MTDDHKTVALFDDHLQAEAAIRSLEKGGVDMKRLSIVGLDYHTEENVVGYVHAGDRARYWGKFGALWGGVWGLLFGSAMLLVPGFGHLVILGPLASALLNLAGGAVVGGGVGALGGALASVGIPPDAVLQYESAIKAGKFALVFHGSEEEAGTARALLEKTASYQIDSHVPQGAAV